MHAYNIVMLSYFFFLNKSRDSINKYKQGGINTDKGRSAWRGIFIAIGRLHANDQNWKELFIHDVA